MASRKRSELAAGLFVVAALMVGIAALLWLGVADFMKQRGQEVVFRVHQSQGNLGLEIGSAVKVNDAYVGKIDNIRLDLAEKCTLYDTRLERKDVRVHADASARVVVEFIGGASVVLEDLGSPKEALADAKNPIALTRAPSTLIRQAQEQLGFGEEQRTQFQEIIKDVAEASEKVRSITHTLAGKLDPDDPDALLAKVEETAENLRASSSDLLAAASRLKAETDRSAPASLLAKVHASADHVNEATGNASEMVKKIRPDIEDTVTHLRDYTRKDVAAILADLRKANTELVNIVGDFREVSKTSREIVVLNRENIDEIIANLKSTSLNLKAGIKEIRRSPWRVLKQPSDKDVASQNIYDAARVFADGAEQLDDALARLNALSQAQPSGVKADDPELVKIREHLESTFEKLREAEDGLWKALPK